MLRFGGQMGLRTELIGRPRLHVFLRRFALIDVARARLLQVLRKIIEHLDLATLVGSDVGLLPLVD